MTKKEVERLRRQLDMLEDDEREEFYRQMDVLASDSDMTDEERDRFYAQIRERVRNLREVRELFRKKLGDMNVAIDEVETRLSEQEKQEKHEKKKHRLLPVTPTNAQIDYQERKQQHFARGMTFYKMFWVYFIGCFAGVVIETIWCLIRNGHFESRVALIYGPFNPVYGVGALALSLALYRFRNRGSNLSFIGGFLVGSAVEYVCSFLQELVFGSTSWDYSNMPYNLNGRICLLYSVFWGILGIMWIKNLYPRMAKIILKIPNRMGKGLTWAILVFMVFDSAMSMAAVLRWQERRAGEAPSNALETYFDAHYPDERMHRIYANAEFTEDREARAQEEEYRLAGLEQLEALSRDLGQKTAETLSEAMEALKNDMTAGK